MIYQRDCNVYYIKLLHLLTDSNIHMNLINKRKLDNKIIDLVKLLEKIKEESDKDELDGIVDAINEIKVGE